MTTMFGSVHCCSQVLIRERPKEPILNEKLANYSNFNEEPGFELKFNRLKKYNKNKQNTSFAILIGPSFNNDMEDTKNELYEYSIIHQTLTRNDINCLIFQQCSEYSKFTPFSQFPIHMFTTHNDKFFMYPMNPHRQHENKKRVIEILENIYGAGVNLENDKTFEKYLEGDASLIFDRLNHEAFIIESDFSDLKIAKYVTHEINYKLNVLIEKEVVSDLKEDDNIIFGERKHSINELKLLFDKYDSNKEGVLNKNDIISLLTDVYKSNKEKNVNNKGNISKIMKEKFGEIGVIEKEYDKLLAVRDNSGDGTLTWDEFSSIYHTNKYTNSYLFIGTKFCIICSESIQNSGEIIKKLSKPDRKIIEITEEQRINFCASGVVEMENNKGEIIVLISSNAKKYLTKEQEEIIETCCDKFIPLNISSIENSKGFSLNNIISVLH
jgi:hypothetical protein